MNQINKEYHQNKSELDQELELIVRAKENPERFGQLYRKYYVQIFRFVHKRLGNEELAAELTSNVFVKALKALPKYEYKGVPFSAWLYQIARNEVLLHYRSSKNSRVVTLETHHLKDVLGEMDEDQSEGQMRLLMEGLKELNEGDLELVELRYFEQRPFKEVSEILEISVNTAKVRMHRAVSKLKDIIFNK